ncbi:MAG: hypothetical protein MUE41_07830 [Gemmatimonadaceae bacterium]|nr:hypothetical protein [Gemmatimonadaceae bacterium]
MRPFGLLTRRWSRLLVVGATALSTGCVSAMRQAVDGRMVAFAPSGLTQRDALLRDLLVAGAAELAVDALSTRARAAPLPAPFAGARLARTGDDLLDHLLLGSAAFYAGRYGASTESILAAERLAEQRMTRSLTREATALLINDLARGYRPSRTELAMLPYYGTLAFLARGDLDGALVEARRLALRLEETEAQQAAHDRSLRAALRLVTASVFEAAGEWNDAGVARRHVAALTGDSSWLLPDSVRGPGPDSVDVLLVVEQGFAPHRVMQRAVVGGGSIGDALGVLARQDGDGGVFGVGRWRSHGWWLDPRADGGELRDALLLAWPVLSRALAPTAMTAGVGDRAPVPLVMADVGASITDEYRRALPGILTRVAARAAARRATLDLARGKKGKGRAIAAAVAVTAAALDVADTRGWSTLPNGIGVQRLRVPSGLGQVRVHLGGRDLSVPLGRRVGGLVLAHHRAFDGGAPGLLAGAALQSVMGMTLP